METENPIETATNTVKRAVESVTGTESTQEEKEKQMMSAATQTMPPTTRVAPGMFAKELQEDGVQMFDLNHVLNPATCMYYPVSKEEKKKYLVPLAKSAQGAYLTFEMPEAVEGENDEDMGSPTQVEKQKSAPGSQNANVIEVLDGTSSHWSNMHGYRNPHIVKAMVDQLQSSYGHIMFEGIAQEPAVKLAAMLLDIAPKPFAAGSPSPPPSSSSWIPTVAGVTTTSEKEENPHPTSEELQRFTKVYYGDSGSMAVEVAMKVAIQARHFWDDSKNAAPTAKQTKFVTIRKGYHGDTFAALSVDEPDSPLRKFFDNKIPPNIYVSEPECRRNDCDAKGACVCPALKELNEALSKHKSVVAGVILEPIFQGGSAMRVYSPHFLRGVREACSKHEVVMIVDEIATGFGRLGTMWGCDIAGIVPDVMTVGKGLSGGHIPLSAVLITEKIARMMPWTPAMMHGPTYSGNALACSAGIASVHLMMTTPWQERAKSVEAVMKRKLLPFAAEHREMVADVRVLGAVAVIEMKHSFTPEIMRKARMRALRKWRCLLRPSGKLVSCLPPFNAPLEEEEIERLADAMMDMAEFLQRCMSEKQGVVGAIKKMVA